MTSKVHARLTNTTAANEFERVRRPVYEGDRVPDLDRRVWLEDGTACHVHFDPIGIEPYPVLCTAVVAMDAGGNVIRRRGAAKGDSGGVAAQCGHGSLVVVPADGSIVGYYREIN